MYQLLKELKLLQNGKCKFQNQLQYIRNYRYSLLENPCVAIIIVPVEVVQQLHLSHCCRYRSWQIPPPPALPLYSWRGPAGPAAGYTAAEAQGAKAEDSLLPQCSKNIKR